MRPESKKNIQVWKAEYQLFEKLKKRWGVDFKDAVRGYVRSRNEEAVREAVANGSAEMVRPEYSPIQWATDPNGSCSFTNDGWRDLTGQTLEESRGLGWTKCVHADDLPKVLADFRSANEARKPYFHNYRVYTVSEEYVWVRGGAEPHFAEDGTFLGYIGLDEVTPETTAELAAALMARN